MNELEFKRHLKDLAHGHHHPEEHDWTEQPAHAATKGPAAKSAAKKTTSRKSARKK
jgi:hypothetical protein